jgi:hypothetical protein
MPRHKIVVAVLLATLLSGGAAVAANERQDPACKRAEINPITGHVFCIDPLGAHVEAPPESIAPKCERNSRGQWTWAPSCRLEPEAGKS